MPLFNEPTKTPLKAKDRGSTQSRALATKLCSPFGVPTQVVSADGGSGRLDGLNKVLYHEWGLEKLVRPDVCP